MAPQVIPPIAPERVTPSFLSTFRDQSNNPDWAGWERGITFVSGCHPVQSWPNCVDDPEEEKDSPNPRGPVSFESVSQYTAIQCEFVTDTSAIDADVLRFLDAGASPTLALAVLAGITPHGLIPNNPSLANVASSEGTGFTPGQGVAILLEAHGLCTLGTRRPYLHIPVAVLPFMLSKGLIWPEGDFYRGPGGLIVSADPGYLAGYIAPTEFEGAGSADEVWMYLSGPVEYALEPLSEDNVLRDTDTRRMNTYEALGERQVIYRFDPCCVFAVRVVVPNECCSEVEELS